MSLDLAAAMAPSAIGSGWANTGKNIAETVSPGPEAYMKGANASLDLIKKQAEARMARNKAMARETQLKKLLDSGMPPAMAELADNIMQGETGSDFNSATSGMQTLMETSMMEQAATPGVPIERQNQLNNARIGRNVPLTEIKGGNAYDPNVAPGDQEMLLTPDAAADNMRDSLVDQSQITRNNATGEAALIRANTPRTSSIGRPQRDPVLEHANKKKVDEVMSRWRPQIAKAMPEDRPALLLQRDAEIAQITADNMGAVSIGSTGEQDADIAAKLWADEERASGRTPSDGEVEEAKRRLRAGGRIHAGEVLQVTNDGTRPDQVIDPATKKPVTGGRGDKPGNKTFNKDVYAAAHRARHTKGKSKAGIVAKMRANGYHQEAAAFEQREK